MLIPLEGVLNFRDIGGYSIKDGGRLRRGLIYRSASLDHATDNDRAVFTKLGIKTVFDLRLDSDISEEGLDKVGPDMMVIRAPTTLVEGDVFAEIRDRNYLPKDYYCDSLAPRAAYHADLFTQILEHLNHPLVIHCSGGKDRTGTTIALLMRLAGVNDIDIITDYAKTRLYMAEPFAELRLQFQAEGFPDFLTDALLDCSPDTMRVMLNHLDKTFGSVENYLQQGGMSVKAMDQLRAALVEK